MAVRPYVYPTPHIPDPKPRIEALRIYFSILNPEPSTLNSQPLIINLNPSTLNHESDPLIHSPQPLNPNLDPWPGVDRRVGPCRVGLCD